MSQPSQTLKLSIGGMTCARCQQIIAKQLNKTPGILSAKVDYQSGTAEVVYNSNTVSAQAIRECIEKLGYTATNGPRVTASPAMRAVGLVIIVFALYWLLETSGVLNLLAPSTLADTGTSYGMLFVIGLMTSVHCIAMCGGINLSQCVTADNANAGTGKFASLRPSFLYNLGRVISYTVVGFVVGALGSAVTFSPFMQGLLKLLAGVWMVIMGINMLGFFPWLRKLVPHMPKGLAGQIDSRKGSSSSPLVVGLLNGLMPCGPLQAMQLYALSTGNAFAGALSMLLFSLGTVPLMFGLGALSSILSRKFTHKMITVGAVLVVVLGLSMFSQGWSLSGFSVPTVSAESDTAVTATTTAAPVENGVQVVTSSLVGGRYPSITVKAGTPVQWTINAPQGSINGCNYRMFIQEYGVEHTFDVGDNLIEFTPTKTGTFPYSCWMGMIRATITVVAADAELPEDVNAAPAATKKGALSSIVNNDAPRSSGYIIPTDSYAIAEPAVDEYENDIQRVTITFDGKRFSPAVVVVQEGLDVEWNIQYSAASEADTNALVVPEYATELGLLPGINQFYLTPVGSFVFSSADGSGFGYVKVVPSLDDVDQDAISTEVSKVPTLIYPAGYFTSTQAGGDSCCQE